MFFKLHIGFSLTSVKWRLEKTYCQLLSQNLKENGFALQVRG